MAQVRLQKNYITTKKKKKGNLEAITGPLDILEIDYQ